MLEKIFLEITNACNLACSFCPPTRREKAFIRPERFERFLEGLASPQAVLFLHLKGEPLLHPDLARLVAIAAGRGHRVGLTTNGTLVGERATELLGAPGIDKLSVSLHSHAGASGVEGYWRGVEAFLDLHRASPSFPVSLRLWNRGERGLPAGTEELWSLVERRYPGAGAWSTASDGWKSRKLDHRVYLNQAASYTWPDSSLPRKDATGFCRGLRNQVGVLVDGTVVPCCMDGEGELALGSLLDAPLAEILQSPRARAIYEGFSRRSCVEPLCATCGYRRKFS
jgi:sulfatase maturation enzyme AslB (radical SAM superfamily)